MEREEADLDVLNWLATFYPPNGPTPPVGRPFVTLTYAQSLDGKIAGKDKKQILLSGAESMRLTHRLREIHDTILVGIGTMLSDDPQLNARIPTLLPLSSQPQPIILDIDCKTPLTARLISNYIAGIGPQPIVICDSFARGDNFKRVEALTLQGFLVDKCPVEKDNPRHLSLVHVVEKLAHKTSLMVEGGASVISAFLASGVVDLVVVTIAPVFVGEGLSMYNEGKGIKPNLELLATRAFGNDIIAVYRPRNQ